MLIFLWLRSNLIFKTENILNIVFRDTELLFQYHVNIPYPIFHIKNIDLEMDCFRSVFVVNYYVSFFNQLSEMSYKIYINSNDTVHEYHYAFLENYA